MTKAKRYEGEKARGELWHSRMHNVVWQAKHDGMAEIEHLVRGKFNAYAETKYNPHNSSYDIVLELGPRSEFGPMGYLQPLEVLLTHVEDYMEFPSDHLKTKLLLIAG